MTPKGTQNHPKSSQWARKQFLEVPRGAEVEKVSQKATKGYQKERIWEPLGLPFGTLFQKNRSLEAASNFDLIFHAFRQPPGLPFEVIFSTFSLKNIILERVGSQAAVSVFFCDFREGPTLDPLAPAQSKRMSAPC